MTTSAEQLRVWRKRKFEQYTLQRDAYYALNKVRIDEKDRAWRKANPEKVRESQKRSRAKKPPGYSAARCRAYRFSKRQVLHPMPGACDICNTPRGAKNLYWDHDHPTGKHRGWLCNHCNLAIGQLKDSPVLLRAAADYLERSAAKGDEVSAVLREFQTRMN